MSDTDIVDDLIEATRSYDQAEAPYTAACRSAFHEARDRVIERLQVAAPPQQETIERALKIIEDANAEPNCTARDVAIAVTALVDERLRAEALTAETMVKAARKALDEAECIVDPMEYPESFAMIQSANKRLRATGEIQDE